MIKFYNTDEVAEILGVTRRTVWSYTQGGKLNGRKLGRGYLFTEEEITDFIKRTATPIKGSQNPAQNGAISANSH